MNLARIHLHWMVSMLCLLPTLLFAQPDSALVIIGESRPDQYWTTRFETGYRVGEPILQASEDPNLAAQIRKRAGIRRITFVDDHAGFHRFSGKDHRKAF